MKEKLKEGTKNDKGKLRYDLIPVKALAAITQILTFGSIKYADRNWEKGIMFGRVYGALQRHLNAWWNREDPDSDSKLSHIFHAGCCVLFLIHYQIYYELYKKFDDRPIYEV